MEKASFYARQFFRMLIGMVGPQNPEIWFFTRIFGAVVVVLIVGFIVSRRIGAL